MFQAKHFSQQSVPHQHSCRSTSSCAAHNSVQRFDCDLMWPAFLYKLFDWSEGAQTQVMWLSQFWNVAWYSVFWCILCNAHPMTCHSVANLRRILAVSNAYTAEMQWWCNRNPETRSIEILAFRRARCLLNSTAVLPRGYRFFLLTRRLVIPPLR